MNDEFYTLDRVSKFVVLVIGLIVSAAITIDIVIEKIELTDEQLCKKHFNLARQSISIEKSRPVNHKKDRPAQITIICGDNYDN